MDAEALKIAVYRRLPRRWQQKAVRLATPNFSVGAMVFLTDNGGRVLLVRPTYRDGWLPPGGFLGRGESAEQTIAREMREELDLDVQAEPPHRVFLDAARQGVTFVCAARIPTTARPRVAGPELREWQWFDLDAIPTPPAEFHEGITSQDLDAVRRLA
jgi:ADP-ribose pyrophosphatase YjhB (NUDIX family)